ncbi:MAG: hypothetical protein RIG77_11075 [Cyclobacteriaceae bacterium]
MPQVSLNIHDIGVKKGLTQKEVGASTDLLPMNHNGMANGDLKSSIEVLGHIYTLFDMAMDQAINYGKDIPQEVSIEKKYVSKKKKLIELMEDAGRQAIIRMIDSKVTKSMFQGFFTKNLAAL